VPSKTHVNILKNHDIKISMDGEGRATDNICIERFWRSIKYKNMKVPKKFIGKYMNDYNQKRLHSALDYQTPNKVYFQAINNPNSKGDKKLPKYRNEVLLNYFLYWYE